MTPNILDSAPSGRHITDAPLTLTASEEAVPGLLRNVIDRRIVKVRPSSTPIDQLSRCAGARPTRSMTVEYYSVDPKRTDSVLSSPIAAGAGKRRGDGLYVITAHTSDDVLFEPSETVIFPDISVQPNDAAPLQPLVAYVVARTDTAGLEIIAVNAPRDESGKPLVPEIPVNTKIVRMGRAAAELDVQTPQFQCLPTKASNHCQIFKMQVEESTLHRIANKEIGWTFSDQEEAAVIDMRLGMEKNFLFGAAAKIVDPNKNEEVYLTGGIWSQAGRHCEVDVDKFTERTLIEIAEKAFTGNCGSKRKILVCGTGLMSAISKIDCTRCRRAGETYVKWGLTFNEIVTNFGSLFIIHSETFDQCGHRCDGLVIDPDYLTKYVHLPFHTEKLDLRSSGTRNTSAVVITEASCLVLRYPDTHLRINGRSAKAS